MKYVVTEYWNNGESWEDEMHGEYPVKIFKSIESALKYISAYGEIESRKEHIDYEREDMKFLYYTRYEDDSRDDMYDFSWNECRIYEVEEGD